MVFKIKQINPVATNIWEEPNRKILSEYKNPNTQIHIATIKAGPIEVTTTYHDTKAVNYVLEEAEKAEKEGFDAIVMSCFLDVGVDAMREAVDIPVVGACQASVHLASLLGTRISIITDGPKGKRHIEDLVNKYGFAHKLVSIRHVDLTPLQFAVEKEPLKKQLLKEAKKAIDEDGADVLILGCGGMNVAPWLQEQTGVPVIDPLVAALKTIEILGTMKLTQSKLAYPKP
jgi:allantoin racemase